MPIKSILALTAVLAAAGPALAAGPTATAPLLDAAGAAIGKATFTEAPTGVLIRIEIDNLQKPGWHAVHLHDKGDCMTPAFTSAGAHMNMPMDPKTPHGLMTPKGGDFGDLPNVYVSHAGKLAVELFTDRVSLSGAGGRPALLDADGSALVMHENPDDYVTQPIGGAGARIACGVVKPG
jgi:Cu-Zn family superoxide dismutase